MRVKCIDDTGCLYVAKDEVYKVLQEDDSLFLVELMKGVSCAVEKTRFINPERFAREYSLQFGTVVNGVDFTKDVREDKMDQVRIVRKLEDLDGLENGMGFVLSLISESSWLRVSFKNKMIIELRIVLESEKKEAIEILKAMGFNFEYKPLRTKEEVVKDMKLNSEKFIFNGFNYYIRYVEQFNKYYMDYHCSDTIVGALYFNRETAEKYVTELNEILESEKNGF